MTDDREYQRKLEDRIAALRAQAGTSDAATGEGKSDAVETEFPVKPGRRPRERRGWLFIAALVLFSFVVGELALTVQGWSSPDFADATRRGRATVVSCERVGPVGRGFGYWDRCTADVVWDGGFAGRYTFDRRNFIDASEVGRTFTIGENAASRSTSVGYSRPEAAHRPLVIGVGFLLMLAAMIPVLLLIFAFLSYLRDLFRRKR